MKTQLPSNFLRSPFTWTSCSTYFGITTRTEISYDTSANPQKKVIPCSRHSLQALGDTIGCSIDTSTGEVKYWLNGNLLGIALADLAMDSNPNALFYPFIRITERAIINLNLTGPFKNLPEGYKPVANNIDPRDVDKLSVRAVLPKRYACDDTEYVVGLNRANCVV